MAMDTARKGPYHILLVEDNPGDVELTKELIEESGHEANLVVVGDGEPAMAYLRQQGEYAGAQRPDLILLDLNLPAKDGLEVLQDMAADQELSTIPVMVLTGTEAEESLLESYNVPVSRFSRKPIELARFNDVVSRLGDQSLHRPIISPRESPPALETEKSKKWWWPF
jgi:CheY-like chemotaxis protein